MLATLSTVVGIATGMFTLRDQVFPEESGTAGAVSESSYQEGIGDVCDTLNGNERARARDTRQLDMRVRGARTTEDQRLAVLDATRRVTSRASHTMAQFSGLTPSERLAAGHERTKAVWSRNLDRVLAYTEDLDRATNRTELERAIKRLSRPDIERDGIKLNAELLRLGGANCRFDPPIQTRTVKLPLPKAESTAAKARKSSRRQDRRSRDAVNPNPTPVNTPEPTPAGDESTGGVRVNPPDPSGGGGGGGGAGEG